MTSPIRILFVGPPCKNSVENQKLIASGNLPVMGNFVATGIEAISYLGQLSQQEFPEVIILDDQIGYLAIEVFVDHYRRLHYVQQMGTMIYIGNHTAHLPIWENEFYVIAGSIPMPLTKHVFLSTIYPAIPMTVF